MCDIAQKHIIRFGETGAESVFVHPPLQMVFPDWKVRINLTVIFDHIMHDVRGHGNRIESWYELNGLVD